MESAPWNHKSKSRGSYQKLGMEVRDLKVSLQRTGSNGSNEEVAGTFGWILESSALLGGEWFCFFPAVNYGGWKREDANRLNISLNCLYQRCIQEKQEPQGNNRPAFLTFDRSFILLLNLFKYFHVKKSEWYILKFYSAVCLPQAWPTNYQSHRQHLELTM